MAFIIPFIPLIASAIGGGAAIASGVMQSNASNNATNAQLTASERAAQLESSNFDKSIEAAKEEQDYNRWLTQQTAAARQPYLDQLSAAMGSGWASYAPTAYTPGQYESAKPFVAPDPNEVRKDPGYQFELEQGVDAINRTGAARGTLLTGGTLKDATAFGEGLAATRAGEQRDRALQEYSLAETLRQGTFDRNESAKFNAAQLNNQSAYQAASLANQGLSARLSSLSSLASLALPTGTYPGYKGGDTQHPLPYNTPIWQPGMSPYPGMGATPDVGGAIQPKNGLDYLPSNQTDPSTLPYGPWEADNSAWSGALARRRF